MDVFKQVGTYAKDKLEGYTEGMKWPASKDEIIRHAKDRGLPQQVVDQLEKMPDKTYNNVGEVVGATAKGMV